MREIKLALFFVLFFALVIGSDYWRAFSGDNAALTFISNLFFSHLNTGAPSDFNILWVAVTAALAARLYWLGISVRRHEGKIGCVQLARFLSVALFSLFIALNYLAFQGGQQPEELTVLLTGLLVSQSLVAINLWCAQKGIRNIVGPSALLALMLVLFLASLFHPDWTAQNQIYYFHNVARWTGPCRNPNQFGVLMAAAIPIAITCPAWTPMLFSRMRRTDSSSPPDRYPRWLSWILPALTLPCALLALLKSYSRGAWFGAMAGVAYLAVCWFQDWKRQTAGEGGAGIPLITPKIRSLSLHLLVLVAATLLLCFWHLRDTDSRMIRRAFSVGNVNDLSWRNRVDAYVGGLRIMADKPWLGCGWSRPGPLYSEYYMNDKLTDGLAIVMNDYLTLGMTLGLPALCCFAFHVWSSLRVKARPLAPTPSPSGVATQTEGTAELWMARACRAGTWVFLVGFFFDRGLLMLLGGIPFWTLLALGTD